MASSYPQRLLVDIVENLDSRRIPLSKREREQRRGCYPYYGATGVMDYVDDYLFEGLHLLVAEDGSVETATGKPFLQLVDGKFWVNNHAHVLRGMNDTETRYIYYALSTAPVRPFLTGSVQGKLSQSNLNRIPVPYPENEVDRCTIAQILGTLDEKIELNQRTNETLETIARAIFKSWFVDFDPVQAKAEGREKGLPEHIADLFPDRFVDSDLGEIPEGWDWKSLGDVIELAYGKGLKADNRNPGIIPVIGSNGQIGWHDEFLSRGPGIVVGRKGNPGTVTWIESDFFPIDTTFYVVPIGEITSMRFLFHALRLHNLPSLAADSAVPGLNRNLAYMSLQLVPQEQLIHFFDRYIQSLDICVQSNNFENQVLSDLRDTLLPKLISGELRIKNAEKFLHDVT
jgi:type I restriction enzyme S subunit